MIREATEEDFADIERQSKKFWEFTQFSEEVPYKDGSALFYIRLAYDCGLLFVLEIDNKVVGFTAGVISPMMGDSDVYHGSELAWWVEPEHRRGRGGILLIKALESKAYSLGCKYWNMVAMRSSMPDTIEKMYVKLGYELTETTWNKRLH